MFKKGILLEDEVHITAEAVKCSLQIMEAQLLITLYEGKKGR